MTHKKITWSPALLLAALACNSPPSTSAPATAEAPKPAEAPKLAQPSASAAPAESAAPARPRRPERAGLAGVMFAAARDLELPADKKESLDKLDDGLGGPPADPEARKALEAAMIEGVKAGKVEMAKLEPSLVLLDKAAAAHKDAEIKALDALHKELDATQRKALVEAVKKRQADRAARFEKHGKPEKDDKAQSEQRAKRRLERLTQELGLDADQQKKAEPILGKHDMGREGFKMGGAREEMQKRVDALLTAFEKDTFSAAKLDFGADAKRYREMAKKRAEYLNALLGVVKPEQREKLAATVEERPRGARGPGRRGPRPGGGRPMGAPPMADEPGEDEPEGE